MTSLPRNNKLTVQDEKTGNNPLFPIFLKLNNLHTVLIGAGKIGLEKLTAITNNSPDARVTVIALSILPEIHQLASEFRGVSISQKSFIDSDLNDADVVIAATGDSELNNFIRESARGRKLLVNI